MFVHMPFYKHTYYCTTILHVSVLSRCQLALITNYYNYVCVGGPRDVEQLYGSPGGKDSEGSQEGGGGHCQALAPVNLCHASIVFWMLIY